MAFNKNYRSSGHRYNRSRYQREQNYYQERYPDFLEDQNAVVEFSGLCISTDVSEPGRHDKPGRPMTREQEFSSILECPVCFSIPEMEIFNCDKGHSVCGDCLKRLAKCALCSAPYNGSRNFMAESVVAHFKKFGIPLDGTKSSSKSSNLFNCSNKSQGCKALLFRSEMDNHEKACEFRPVKCQLNIETKCRENTFVNLSEYFNHLVQCHKITGATESSGVFTKVDRLFMGLEITTSWPPFYLQYDGKTFLRFATIRNRKVSWWIQLIGPESECRKYRAVISLYHPHKPDTKISWSVPVFSIHTIQNIIEESNIATISATQMLPFCVLGDLFENRVATHTWCCGITLFRSQ